jgi:tetratricopeptide (TPR) repeat protein
MVQIGAAANAATKVGRNDPCPCGSGRKYKHCCQPKETAARSAVAKAGPSPASKTKALTAAGLRHAEAGRHTQAIAAFREIVQLDPDNPEAHHSLGLAYIGGGRLNEAALTLSRAVNLRPSFVKALRALASLLENLGQSREAAAVYRRLSQIWADGVERRLFAARALLLEDRLEEAETELRRVIAVAPRDGRGRILLGRLLLEQGSFEEAERHLAAAGDGFPDAFHAITMARRMTETDRPLAERMRERVERSQMSPTQRVAVRFGLGKTFDDLGDIAEAMRHYEAGNRLRATRLDREGLSSYYDRIVANFPATAFKQGEPRPARPGDDLPVFIVGMPRSGTTLVEQILSSHRLVAGGGELTFWHSRILEQPTRAAEAGGGGASKVIVNTSLAPDDASSDDWHPAWLGPADADALARAAEDYLAILRAIGPNAERVTDKAPTNFERLGTIRLALPNARIIHCRRSPIDTCLSIFLTNLKRPAWDRADLVFFYRQYERLMAHWRSFLPADRFTEVDYATLIADSEAETRRLIAFCGLEWDDACLFPERNGRSVRTVSAWQVRQPVYRTSIDRWRRYEPWLGELRELLPPVEGAS